jgi:hypothetical protein
VREVRTQPVVEKIKTRKNADRKDRRKHGVKRRNAVKKLKNKSKILLTGFGVHTILPLRQSLSSPENVPAFLLPIRAPENTSARSAGVCTIRK